MVERGQTMELQMEDGTTQRFMVVGGAPFPVSDGEEGSVPTWIWLKSADETVNTGIHYLPPFQFPPHPDQREALIRWYSQLNAKDWGREGEHPL